MPIIDSKKNPNRLKKMEFCFRYNSFSFFLGKNFEQNTKIIKSFNQMRIRTKNSIVIFDEKRPKKRK